MVVVQTNRGAIDLSTPGQIAAAINAGLIDLQQGAQAQKDIVGGPANTRVNNPPVGPSGVVPPPPAGTPAPPNQQITGGTQLDIPARSVEVILADFKAGRISEGAAFDEMFLALQALGQTDVIARDNVRDIIRVANEDLALLGGTDPNQAIRERLTETRGGRQNIFSAFNATQFSGLPGRFRNLLDQRFDPLSARFALSSATDPGGTPLDFRSFLGGGPAGLTSGEFGTAFDQLAPLFASGASLGQEDINRRSLFDQEGVTRNIIGEFIRAGTNPIFRRSINANLGDAFSRFQDVNPGATGGDIFGAFLGNRRLMGGGFGQGGF